MKIIVNEDRMMVEVKYERGIRIADIFFRISANRKYRDLVKYYYEVCERIPVSSFTRKRDLFGETGYLSYWDENEKLKTIKVYRTSRSGKVKRLGKKGKIPVSVLHETMIRMHRSKVKGMATYCL